MTVEPFTPKAGMRCMMRNGEEVGPLEVLGDGDASFDFVDPETGETWTRHGRWLAHGARHDYDLVSEIPTAAIARLEADNAGLREAASVVNAMVENSRNVVSLRAQVEALQAALEPFAKINVPPDYRDTDWCEFDCDESSAHQIQIGDLRRARAALAKSKGE